MSNKSKDSSSEHTISYRVINADMNYPKREVAVGVSPLAISQLAEEGYLVQENFFNAGQVAEFRKALEEVHSIEKNSDYLETYEGNATFIRYLAEKHIVFLDLVRKKEIVSIVRAVLGPQIQLLDMVGRLTSLEKIGQQLHWHIHNRVIPEPLPPLFSYPHCVDVLIYLDDINELNGSLCILPKSHKSVHLDIPYKDYSSKPDEMVLSPKAGTCIFIHSNLWHRVMASTKAMSGERRVLLLGFAPAWFKREFSKERRGISEKIQQIIRESGSDLQELFGHFEWN